jgi:hypothetical protein
MTDWLTTHNDKRITAFGNSATGFLYGLIRDSAITWGNTNTWVKVLQEASTPGNAAMPIITASEIYLARAQAAFLHWTTEDVTSLYKQDLWESCNTGMYTMKLNSIIICNNYLLL